MNSFSESAYAKAADALGLSIPLVKAVAEVESGGRTLWDIDGKQLPPIRPEAHWFGKFTGYRYNDSHPQISSRAWNPSLAAKSWKEAWIQYDEMAQLDETSAIKSTSWGAFQIMGFHWQALGYSSAQAMKEAAFVPDEQLGMFVRFIQANVNLQDALKRLDFQAFAAGYNGPGAIDVYSAKIASAYERNLS